MPDDPDDPLSSLTPDQRALVDDHGRHLRLEGFARQALVLAAIRHIAITETDVDAALAAILPGDGDDRRLARDMALSLLAHLRTPQRLQ